MTLEQCILETVRSLPADKQQELLDHAKQLQAERQPRVAFTSVKGLWADLNISLSATEKSQGEERCG